ncbi:Uncharacterised protein [Vibrio cholerae]|nr:Uncharacterised protein [Vibrio cholerae]
MSRSGSTQNVFTKAAGQILIRKPAYVKTVVRMC